MEDDLFNITIKIAEKSFKPRIKRSDEILYRKAVNYVDKKFLEYRNKHPKQNTDTHLSLVSLDLALELLREKEDKDSDYDRIETLVKELEEKLTK